MRFFSLFISILISCTGATMGQDSVNFKRLKPFVITASSAYIGTMVYLNETWYEEQQRSSFHFFNDNPEWKQMDKVGHLWTAFHLSSGSYEGLRWSGVTHKKAAILGSVAGLAMILPVEWLDGYAEKYGASAGDIIADFAGSALYLSQQLIWDEVRITPKFSFNPTKYAKLRPNVLGDGLQEEWLKDYNGQTYWFSFDTDKLLNTKAPILSYLNLAVGYGADGMVYGRDYENEAAGFNSFRQYYLAIDIDLTAIKTSKKWLKPVLFILNTIHLPSPSLSYGKGRFKFHPLYF